MRFTVSISAVAALALAACSPADEGNESTAEAGHSGAPQKAEVEAGTVQLGGGVIAVTGAMGTSLAYGSPRETVEAELTKVLGPSGEKSSNGECGAGPMEFTKFDPGLTLNFQDGKLVGWYLEGKSTLRSDKGIGIGSTAAEFVAAHSAEPIDDSTLGSEYYSEAGNIGAFMSESAEKPVVESLYSGTNCFFR